MKARNYLAGRLHGCKQQTMLRLPQRLSRQLLQGAAVCTVLLSSLLLWQRTTAPERLGRSAEGELRMLSRAEVCAAKLQAAELKAAAEPLSEGRRAVVQLWQNALLKEQQRAAAAEQAAAGQQAAGSSAAQLGSAPATRKARTAEELTL